MIRTQNRVRRALGPVSLVITLAIMTAATALA